MIPKLINQILRGEQPTIFGDGTQSRDFTFVQDVVDANMKAMGLDVQGVFNVSAGNAISILSLVERICKLTGKKNTPSFITAHEGEIKHSLADLNAARTALNYSPKYDIDNGLEITIGWYKKIINLMK